jgi:hypothetical protein
MRYLFLLLSLIAFSIIVIFWLHIIPTSSFLLPQSVLPQNQVNNPPPQATLHPRVINTFIPDTQNKSLEYQDKVMQYQDLINQ